MQDSFLWNVLSLVAFIAWTSFFKVDPANQDFKRLDAKYFQFFMSFRQMWSAEHFRKMHISDTYTIQLQCSCRFIPKYTVYKFIYLVLLLFCPYLNLFRHICVLVQEYRTKEKFASTVLNLPTDDEGQKGLK